MASFEIGPFLRGLLKTALFVLFGLVVFILTALLLYRKDFANGAARYTTISEADSCYLEYSRVLRKSGEGIILLYVETKPCAKCSESIILSTVSSIYDAVSGIEPIMLYHIAENFDSSAVEDYYDRFAQHIDLIVSSEDSIMIRNPWMPQNLGFYGIVTDSLDRVWYAGSLLDQEFLACCSRLFGKEKAEWD